MFGLFRIYFARLKTLIQYAIKCTIVPESKSINNNNYNYYYNNYFNYFNYFNYYKDQSADSTHAVTPTCIVSSCFVCKLFSSASSHTWIESVSWRSFFMWGDVILRLFFTTFIVLISFTDSDSFNIITRLCLRIGSAKLVMCSSGIVNSYFSVIILFYFTLLLITFTEKHSYLH